MHDRNGYGGHRPPTSRTADTSGQITVTLYWQEVCDYQTAFTLTAEIVAQMRENGLDPASLRDIRNWLSDGDEATWFESADIKRDLLCVSEREITRVRLAGP